MSQFTVEQFQEEDGNYYLLIDYHSELLNYSDINAVSMYEAKCLINELAALSEEVLSNIVHEEKDTLMKMLKDIQTKL